MDYEDDLSAPVWDDLNPPTEVMEGTERMVDTATSSDREVEEGNEEEQEGEDVQLFEDKTIGEEMETQRGLINDLAPEEDPLSGLLNGSPKKDPLGASLFDSQISPLIVAEEGDQLDNTKTASPRRHGAPKKLFDSSRIRLNRNSSAQNATTDAAVMDPLGKAEKEREFVDEPLDQEEETSRDSKSTIFEQVEGPLFTISPRKPNPIDRDDVDSTKEPNVDAQNIDHQGDEQVKEELVKFSIEVRDPITVGTDLRGHVEYTIISESEILQPNYIECKRRYRDFRWLYRQLQNNHWGKVVPPPPQKITVLSFNPEFIEKRRSQMQLMLQRIANDQVLQHDPDFHMFLTSENFREQSRERSYVSGSNANNDDSDLSEIHISEIELLGPEDASVVIRNGGLDSDYKKGFMSLSFTSLPKYNEPDTFFIEELEKVEKLEERLQQMLTAVESIEEQRTKLSSYTYEMANLIESLGALDVSKESSDLCYELADTQKRVKESLERDAIQENITMGSTLDEYVRSLASLRAVFNQRARLGYLLVVVENDLVKKKQEMGKLFNNSKQPTNKERFIKTRDNVKLVERRVLLVKKAWSDIGVEIRKEFEKFNKDKMEEFRNSMEISLESAIESQKESIELWETMYQNNL
ncbi:Vacuolar protein sorting-associated protein 5 [Nakaseomyces bracarensis]|uniref:Vacuolar protein sorting-associated protein 5 n=1 Tax=Nakaseomyces bracarensis TaxID=273131 RepID=A0ABR4NXL7_9SACH